MKCKLLFVLDHEIIFETVFGVINAVFKIAQIGNFKRIHERCELVVFSQCDSKVLSKFHFI